MKFTDGFWNLRPGVTAHFASYLHHVALEPDRLTAYAPTRPVNSRGATINQTLITVEVFSPLPNVIGIRLYRHKGGQPKTPTFELKSSSPHAVSTGQDERAAWLTSGRVTVRLAKSGPWLVEFVDGDELITKSAGKSMGVLETPAGVFASAQLGLGVGECVYGLGERFTPFVKNGQVIDLWNEDGGTSSEQAYKNVPFYLTNRGYGVFINHPEKVSLEVGSEAVEAVGFSVPGEILEYFVIYGPTARQVLERYTALTGRPALPPAWSFGLWLSTSFTTNYDEATVTSFIQVMADRHIPLHVFHFDCFWMKEFEWVNFEWDARVFPDPVGMLERLKARGLKICVWINPYIAQQSRLFDEGVAGGFLVKRPNGDIWQWDWWQPGMALVDFTNPAAVKWFGDKLAALLDMGVDCFKTDFGERIPTDVVYHDGSDPFKMHNYYTYLYNKTVFEVLEAKRGRGEAVLFARSGTAGSQSFPVHWGGDNTASFESMAETLRGGLSLGLSGFGFWSHDIGGFEQTASPDLYKRWCAFGLLSSHSRLHGSQSYRVPWQFDEEAVEVLGFFTRLKCQLMPYLYNAAVQAHTLGLPMLRAMLLEFADDPACDYLDRQYMLGDALLVAPVFRPDGRVDYYLPPGRWTHFLSGQVIEGGRWQRESFDYLSLPLMVKPNSIIATGSNDTRPDYEYGQDVTFQLFEFEDGGSCQTFVPNLAGEVALTITAKREADLLNFQVAATKADYSWRVLVRGRNVPAPEHSTAQSTELGTLLTPTPGISNLTIQL